MAHDDALVAPATDPVSGQPESKAAVADLCRLDALWYGFAVSVTEPAVFGDYRAVARTQAGFRCELAGRDRVEDWEAAARGLFGLPDAAVASVASVADRARGTARLAFHDGGRLLAALFVAAEPVAALRDYLAGQPGREAAGILMGRPAGDLPDPGPTLWCVLRHRGQHDPDRDRDRRPHHGRCGGRGAGGGHQLRLLPPRDRALLERVHLREAAE